MNRSRLIWLATFVAAGLAIWGAGPYRYRLHRAARAFAGRVAIAKVET